jgi:hypothetical protein
MKLFSILKQLITESTFIERFNLNGINVEIRNTYESNRAVTQFSSTGRVPIDDILDSMSDIYDVIISQSLVVLESCEKDCALLIRDYRLGFDYQLFIEMRKNKLRIIVNTSIWHPKKLKNELRGTREIIISDSETISIKEDVELNNFTKIVKGDIIIYII